MTDHPNMASTQMSKKRKFVADGVSFAALSSPRLAPQVWRLGLPLCAQGSIICAERRQGESETVLLLCRRGSTPLRGTIELYAEKVNNQGLCAISQAESLRSKLLGGLAVRGAFYGVSRFVMESGAKGCDAIANGKLRAQHAKSMEFKDAYSICSGHPASLYIDSALRHVLLRQGVLAIKVKIMLDWDPKGPSVLEI